MAAVGLSGGIPGQDRHDENTAAAASGEGKKHYYEQRIKNFEKYHERELKKREAAKAAADPVKITLPDGTIMPGIRNFTTPLEVASAISESLAKKCVVAKVDGVPWDLFRPLEADCALSLHNFGDEEGRETFWHSSAHLLGQALELEYGVDLTIGPALDEGYYYDCFMGERTLNTDDQMVIETRMRTSIKEAHEFQRVVVTRAEALEMFQENKFKIEIISGLPSSAVITVYRVGPMVDLCSGPHLPNLSHIKAVAVMACNRSFWRGDVKREGLQRVYAISFPDNKQLREYQHRIEEAKKRDHRLLGANQSLFFFHHLSPGSCFFLPRGARIHNALVQYIREKYWEYEYEEVISPNIYNFDLWHTSGHAEHYKVR
uniref:threonine--tRNA ligase n=2 Tax=Chlamydomonas euryale TaxID=1486919 RepID=A0A6U2CTI3_9CHLO